MKILYGIQGTGHGHISRARELLPQLSRHASVDVLVSGTASQLSINQGITFRKHGISLSYDSNGGVSVLETLRDLRPIRFVSDVQSITPAEYDLVISDYEPVSAWAAKLENVPCVALSHQASFLSPQTPRPDRKSLVAEALFQHFAPADYSIGFHFQQYDDFVKPPLIRSAIRDLNISESNHVTVYLPAYHHEVLKKVFAPFSHVDWHIFSPSCTCLQREKNCWVRPVSNKPFLDSFASCKGVICNAGFETCAEAMYLGKKLLPIPIHRQYEQACNAAALSEMGVMTIDLLQNHTEQIWQWLEQPNFAISQEIADPGQVIEEILNLGHGKAAGKESRSLFRLVG